MLLYEIVSILIDLLKMNRIEPLGKIQNKVKEIDSDK